MQKLFSQPVNIKTDAKEGTFKGYASIFNVVDNYGDVVLPGAFRQTLEELHIKNIKLLWQHDYKKPIGVFTKIEETVTGLLVEGKIFTDLRQGKEANLLLQSGVVDGLSIGYEIVESFYNQDIRYIKQAKLWEISIVTFPANEMARIKDVRAQELGLLHAALNNINKINHHPEPS
jgi:uncharacterized protein